MVTSSLTSDGYTDCYTDCYMAAPTDLSFGFKMNTSFYDNITTYEGASASASASAFATATATASATASSAETSVGLAGRFDSRESRVSRGGAQRRRSSAHAATSLAPAALLDAADSDADTWTRYERYARYARAAEQKLADDLTTWVRWVWSSYWTRETVAVWQRNLVRRVRRCRHASCMAGPRRWLMVGWPRRASPARYG